MVVSQGISPLCFFTYTYERYSFLFVMVLPRRTLDTQITSNVSSRYVKKYYIVSYWESNVSISCMNICLIRWYNFTKVWMYISILDSLVRIMLVVVLVSRWLYRIITFSRHTMEYNPPKLKYVNHNPILFFTSAAILSIKRSNSSR